MIEIMNYGGAVMPVESFNFPGGELSVKVNADHLSFWLLEPRHYWIRAKLTSSEEVIKLGLTVNAIRQVVHHCNIALKMFYVPYARQDRACNKGEAFSLKLFCDYINMLGFYSVLIADPHSEVTSALLNKVAVVYQLDIFHQWHQLGSRVLQGVKFVSPDAGANKKVAELAAYFQHDSFIRADKIRELSTGEIKETVVYCNDLGGQDVMIVDDICDGGKTFIELAKALKSKNCGKIILYVTHGIFSKGCQILREYIDEIWTTDSLDQDPAAVKIYKL